MSEGDPAGETGDDAANDTANDTTEDATGPHGGDLAVVVDRERAEAVVDALASEGVYDDTRSVDAHGEGVAIPVTTPPETVDVREVVEVDLPARNRHLRDLLAARGWSDDELEYVPSSWAVLGSCVVLQASAGRGEGDDPVPRPAEVGEALLELHGAADTVLLHRGVSGTTRDPDVEVLAGAGDTEVVHTEHGTRYAMDLAEVMFAPGNQAERVRMGEVVEAGERVFDMFAGIGYFALPMARAGAEVTAAEIDPGAYRYLVENAVLNGVEDGVSAVRADCRDVETTAERVVMGYYGISADEAEGSETAERSRAGHEFLPTALDALEPGGVLHFHEATPEPELWHRPVGRIEAAADDRRRDVRMLDRRVVKSHAPGVEHVVVDARVD